jgi:hypothetical protein
MSVVLWILAVIAAAVVIVIGLEVPEIRRYLRVRSM